MIKMTEQTNYREVDGVKCILSTEKKCLIFFHELSFIVESKVGKYYLLELKEKYEQIGYKVIHLYTTECKKEDLIDAKIRHIIGESEKKTVYARKCSIRDISAKQKDIFLDMNHIQGSCQSSYNYGMFYNGILLACMTFSKPRVLMNKTLVGKEGYYELVRFATHKDYRVVGAASKLLSHFTRVFSDWRMIYSYADLRWSDGNLYEKIGFRLKRITKPEYYYLIDGNLKHRWGFRRTELKRKFPYKFDPNKTEYQNMLNLGYDKVWDCGSLLFEMENVHDKL